MNFILFLQFRRQLEFIQVNMLSLNFVSQISLSRRVSRFTYIMMQSLVQPERNSKTGCLGKYRFWFVFWTPLNVLTSMLNKSSQNLTIKLLICLYSSNASIFKAYLNLVALTNSSESIVSNLAKSSNFFIIDKMFKIITIRPQNKPFFCFYRSMIFMI